LSIKVTVGVDPAWVTDPTFGSARSDVAVKIINWLEANMQKRVRRLVPGQPNPGKVTIGSFAFNGQNMSVVIHLPLEFNSGIRLIRVLVDGIMDELRKDTPAELKPTIVWVIESADSETIRCTSSPSGRITE
jgi:hypothetical protein